jgi:hypothetical protein
LRVEDVEVRKADLEDVFLDVMSKHSEKPHAGGAPAPGDGRDRSAAREAAALEVHSP